MIALLLIFLLSLLYSVLKGNENSKFMMPPVSRLSVLTTGATMDEQQQQQEDVAPPPPPVDVNVGPAARAGTPVAVPDAEIAADLKEFAVMQLPPPENYANKTGLFKTLWVIHSGEIYGLTGKLIIDFAGLVFAFLTISGLIVFINKIVLKKETGDISGLQIVPVSIQLLVENALKHNISTRKPQLEITIQMERIDNIHVRNNLQKKNTITTAS
mgnify:CR=1 FL=1